MDYYAVKKIFDGVLKNHPVTEARGSEADLDMLNKKLQNDEQLDEAKDMEGKDYTFVSTVRGMSNARKEASKYSNARIVQIDSDFYGVIVPTK